MGISSCTGPDVKEGVADCNAGWGGEMLRGSQLAPVPSQLMLVSVPGGALSL